MNKSTIKLVHPEDPTIEIGVNVWITIDSKGEPIGQVDIDPGVIEALKATPKRAVVKRDKRRNKARPEFRVRKEQNREAGNAHEGEYLFDVAYPFFTDPEYGQVFDPFGIIQNGLRTVQIVPVSSGRVILIHTREEKKTDTYIGIRALRSEHKNGRGYDYLHVPSFFRQLNGFTHKCRTEYIQHVVREDLVILELIAKKA